jgi:hypothetical protein
MHRGEITIPAARSELRPSDVRLNGRFTSPRERPLTRTSDRPSPGASRQLTRASTRSPYHSSPPVVVSLTRTISVPSDEGVT